MKIPEYIAFEGIDGAGKTTQVRSLAKELFRHDVVGICLAEPTYGPHGRRARRWIEQPDPSMDEATRLFSEDRRDHVRRRLLPVLEFVRKNEGFAILQDRYYLSAPAYQGRSRGQMTELLQSQRAIAPTPDITILLDLPVGEALERIRDRRRHSKFETQEALGEIRERFLILSSLKEERVVVVDGTGAPERVTDRILKILERYHPVHREPNA